MSVLTYTIVAMLFAVLGGLWFKTPGQRMIAFGIAIVWPFIPCLLVTWLCLKAGEWLKERSFTGRQP